MTGVSYFYDQGHKCRPGGGWEVRRPALDSPCPVGDTQVRFGRTTDGTGVKGKARWEKKAFAVQAAGAFLLVPLLWPSRKGLWR